MPYSIGRYPEGVVLNPMEYLRNEKNNVAKFSTEAEALLYLTFVTKETLSKEEWEEIGIHIVELEN